MIMKKIYNAVASEYELPQLTPEPRYLYCETITGEWWYKDMQTGEDLPKYATPIEGLDTLTVNQEKVFNEFVENVIDPIEQCQKLQKRIDKTYNYLDKFIPNEYGVLLTERQWNYIKELLQGDDNE